MGCALLVPPFPSASPSPSPCPQTRGSSSGTRAPHVTAGESNAEIHSRKICSQRRRAGSGPSFSQMMDAVGDVCQWACTHSPSLTPAQVTQSLWGPLHCPLGSFSRSRGQCSRGRRISCCWQWGEDISALPCPPITGRDAASHGELLPLALQLLSPWLLACSSCKGMAENTHPVITQS